MCEFVPPHRAGQGVSAARLAGLPFKPLLNGRALTLQSGGSGLAARPMARRAFDERNAMFSSAAFARVGCFFLPQAARFLRARPDSDRAFLCTPRCPFFGAEGCPA